MPYKAGPPLPNTLYNIILRGVNTTRPYIHESINRTGPYKRRKERENDEGRETWERG